MCDDDMLSRSCITSHRHIPDRNYLVCRYHLFACVHIRMLHIHCTHTPHIHTYTPNRSVCTHSPCPRISYAHTGCDVFNAAYTSHTWKHQHCLVSRHRIDVTCTHRIAAQAHASLTVHIAHDNDVCPPPCNNTNMGVDGVCRCSEAV